MKKLLSLCAFLLLCGSMMAQDINVTFTGRDGRDWYVKLDKVEITNLTRDWSDEIVYPDTILELQDHTGVNDFPTQEFALSQNVPNPFEGATDFTLSLPANDKVHISVYDINGKKITSLQRQLNAGVHVFRVLLSTPQTYLLNAKTGSNNASIKMINTGRGAQNQISYLGESGQPMNYQLKEKGGKVFVPGDKMQYVGYATIEGAPYVSDTITQIQLESEEVVLHFKYKAPIDFEPCPYNETIKDIDGNEYPTIWYGKQCWMKENLKTTRFADGTKIEQRNTTSTQNAYYFYPNYDTANVELYGLLYNYTAVTNNLNPADTTLGLQGACPDGWHVPSLEEWRELTTYLQDLNKFGCDSVQSDFAKAMADTMGWKESAENCTVGNDPADNNAAGFSARPAGSFANSGNPFGEAAFWWSSTYDRYNYKVQVSALRYDKKFFIGTSAWKDAGMSIRCVKGDGYTVPMPTLTTDSITDITETTATVYGSIADTAGITILGQGICYSDYYEVPIAISTKIAVEIVDGRLVAQLSSLKPNTTYRVRAYAGVNGGFAYGKVMEFTTKEFIDGKPCKGHETVTDVDGNVYNTVEIGGVCWTKENLRTKRFADGTAIRYTINSNTAVPYYYFPNGDSANAAKYGLLYSLDAVLGGAADGSVNVQGVCPNGWHVPSSSEMNSLFSYVRSQSKYLCNNYNEAKSLAAPWGWTSSGSECQVGYDTLSNNATGFSWVAAGARGSYSNPQGMGTTGVLWNTSNAYQMGNASGYVSSVYSPSRYNCYSVRCILGEGSVVSLPEVEIDSLVDITTTTAKAHATIKNTGAEGVSASMGFCWSKTPNPTYEKSSVYWCGSASEQYSYEHVIEYLSAGTTYYVRAFAENKKGVVYSKQIEFTTK